MTRKPKLDGTIGVGCRLPISILTDIKNYTKPGSFCSALIKDFFKIQIHGKSMPSNETVVAPDGSVAYTAKGIDSIILTIKTGDNVKAIELDAESASHLILKLASAVNSIK